MLGRYSLGSLSAFSKNTRLTEGKDEGNTRKMIQNLLDDHDTIIRMCRNDINTLNDKYKDAGNSDFVTGIMKGHEKMASKLRSYLE